MKKRDISGIVKPETYIKYTSKGVPLGKINKEKENDIKSSEWLKGVTCFVINSNNEILVEERVNKGLTPGKLDLCSGHVNNTEIHMQAMLRELEEELGIPAEESFTNLYQLKPKDCPLVFDNKGQDRNFFITFFCLKKNLLNIKYQKEEINKITWIPMEELFEMMKNGKTKFPKEFDYENIFKQVRNLNIGYNYNKEKTNNSR